MLSPTLLYLLKANGALLLFAVAYFGLLRRLTFFTLNRAYLVFALLFAAVYPALPVPALLPPVAVQPVVVVLMDFATTSAAGPTAAAPAPIDWNAVALAVYGTGVALGLLRLLMQLLSLARLRRRSRPVVVQGVAVRALPGNVSPFSFGSAIYLNPGRHPAAELAAVLRHEQVHVRQWHTLDVLLAHVAQAAAWCNPAAWLLRRALLDNLEYLADHAALQTGLDRQAYQYSLLRLSQVLPGPALVSHFTFPTLKNRVVMMNKPLSSTGQLARYFVAGPLVLAATLGFSGARAQGAGPAVPVTVAAAPAPTASAASAPAHRVSVSVAAPEKAVAAVNPADHQLPEGIKAYIAKTYPGSTIGGWFISDKASEKVPYVKYYASITASNGEKHKLYFNAAEQLVAAPATARAAQPAATEATPSGLAPIPGMKTPPIVYVDGQRYTGSMDDIGASNIYNISVFKGDKARQFFGPDAGNGVLVVTTIANQNSAEVRAFDKKLSEGTPAAAPAQAATSVPYLAAPALEYLTKHYPAARLLGVTELKDANGGPSRYQAEIVIGRRPGYVTFDGAGKFISESYTHPPMPKQIEK